MFLSACKRSWWGCAKGDFHRLTVSRCNNNNNNNNTTVHLRWLNTLKTSCWSSLNRTCGSCRPTLEQRSPGLKKPSFGLHLRHTGVGFTAALRLCGSSGFSTDASRKFEDKYLKQDSRGKGEDPTASSPPANEGHFQFKELYENPWTIPNYLCMARIVLSPVLGYLIMEQYFHVSLGLFALAGATDLLDGYIARNWPNQKSALGSALDPLADKILISVLYVSLTYAQLIPAPLTALIISRDVALIAAVFYVRYKTVPPPVTLSKFFNPCYTTARLKPTLISKINTAVQLFLVAASLAAPVFHYTDSVLLQSLWYITALTTAASGYSYYHYGKKTVEVLNNTK
ncbi:cardiolipin synthase (CMP-forming) [Danio aesculapii]|uniref:cardiolipin synthase (CMP-forming) n=1 Tax=Danio aesculapii TaxID=1142201 RepID=UPI0024C05F5D|nr:cardiolipin synthase (CMP-forming) [Danio aesculapii]